MCSLWSDAESQSYASMYGFYWREKWQENLFSLIGVMVRNTVNVIDDLQSPILSLCSVCKNYAYCHTLLKRQQIALFVFLGSQTQIHADLIEFLRFISKEQMDRTNFLESIF